MKICRIHREIYYGDSCPTCREAGGVQGVSIGRWIPPENLPEDLQEELRAHDPGLFDQPAGTLRIAGDLPQPIRSNLLGGEDDRACQGSKDAPVCPGLRVDEVSHYPGGDGGEMDGGVPTDAPAASTGAPRTIPSEVMPDLPPEAFFSYGDDAPDRPVGVRVPPTDSDTKESRN